MGRGFGEGFEGSGADDGGEGEGESEVSLVVNEMKILAMMSVVGNHGNNVRRKPREKQYFLVRPYQEASTVDSATDSRFHAA